MKRKEHSHNNDVWDLRRHWQTVKSDIQKQLLDGTYRFSPQQEIRFDTETIELWASLDALVLKAVTLVLTRHLKPSRIVSVCWTYYIIGRIDLQDFFGAKNGPKMGHLAVNNGSFPQQRATRIGVVTT